MLHLNASWMKTNKRKIGVGLILLTVIILGYILVYSLTPTDNIMFVYSRDDPTKDPHIVEVLSGYRNFQSCKTDGQRFNYRLGGKPYSFFRCASGCPVEAETERDCKYHD